MKAETAKDEVVLNDDELICILTELRKKATPKEIVLQSVIQQMNDEYGFELADMEREFSFQYEDEFGKSKRGNIDLAIFRAGAGIKKDCHCAAGFMPGSSPNSGGKDTKGFLKCGVEK